MSNTGREARFATNHNSSQLPRRSPEMASRARSAKRPPHLVHAKTAQAAAGDSPRCAGAASVGWRGRHARPAQGVGAARCDGAGQRCGVGEGGCRPRRVSGESGCVAKRAGPDAAIQVDAIHQATHSAVQYTTQAGRVMDGIFASLAADLRTRDNAGLPASSSTNGTGRTTPSRDPRDLLRALAATEADQQSAATVMAASSLPPVSRQAHPAATPRRAPGTPRRAGGLGSTMTPSRRAQQE